MPRFSHAVLAGLLFLVPTAVSFQTDDAFEPPKAALLVTAALLLSARAVLRRESLWNGGSLSWAALALVGSAVLSTALSVHPVTSLWGAHESRGGLWLILAAFVVFLASQTLEAEGAWRTALFLATAGVVAFGLIQWGGADPFEWTRTATWCDRLRPFSTLGHPNPLAGFLSMAAPFVFISGVRSWRARRWLETAALCLLLVALIVLAGATVSRAGWIALALGLAVTAIAIRPGWALLGAGASSAVLLLLAPSAILLRMKSFFESPTRNFIYAAALRIFAKHPVVGAGVDTFQLSFQGERSPEYWALEWGATPQRAHNDFLQLLATQGALGGLAALVGIALACTVLARAWRTREPSTRLQCAELAGCLGAAFVHGLFNFHVAATATLLAVALGRLAALQRGTPVHPSEPAGPLRAWQLAVLSGLFATALLAVVSPLGQSVALSRGIRQQGDLAVAIRAFEHATHWAPWSEAAWTRLGAAAEQAARGGTALSQYALAAHAFTRATVLSPTDAYPHANLGRLLARHPALSLSERQQRSVSEFEAALERDPFNALIALDAIETAVSLQQLDRAREQCEKLLGSYPELGLAWSWLAFISQTQGRSVEAEVFLQNAATGDWRGDGAGQRAAIQRLEQVLLAAGQPVRAAELHLRARKPPQGACSSD
ncbi:MAG: O-antigen ligase family protein [Myxococcaceae bacterium]